MGRRGTRLAVGEVKSEADVIDVGPLLVHPIAEDTEQSRIEHVGDRVVGGDLLPPLVVNSTTDRLSGLQRALAQHPHVQDEAAIRLHVTHLELGRGVTLANQQRAYVARLAASLRIVRSSIQHQPDHRPLAVGGGLGLKLVDKPRRAEDGLQIRRGRRVRLPLKLGGIAAHARGGRQSARGVEVKSSQLDLTCLDST